MNDDQRSSGDFNKIRFSIRKARRQDLPAIHKLINDVFDKRVSHLYTRNGIRTFKGHIDLDQMEARIIKDYWALIAECEDGRILGTIFIKNPGHINLFFVNTEYERKGIGRGLFENVLKMIDPALKKVTVNSSPNSVEAYRNMGFKQTDVEQVLNGIRFIPMEFIKQK